MKSQGGLYFMWPVIYTMAYSLLRVYVLIRNKKLSIIAAAVLNIINSRADCRALIQMLIAQQRPLKQLTDNVHCCSVMI